MITEKIYKSRDNVISLELRSNGIAQDISGATKIALEIGDVVLSSATSTGFDFTTYGSTGRLDIALGHDPKTLTMPKGTYRSRLTVFDLTYPKGRVWDDLMIEVQ
jgi:hypothetical protein